MSSPWDSPDSTLDADGTSLYDDVDYRPMSAGQILFSFEGRIPRSTYWLASLGAGLLTFVAMFGLGLLLLLVTGSEELLNLFVLVMYIPALWMGFAIQAKRWHDRGKSGMMCLVGLIPIVGPIWTLVECGLLEGDAGPNEYGPAPV